MTKPEDVGKEVASTTQPVAVKRVPESRPVRVQANSRLISVRLPADYADTPVVSELPDDVHE